MNSELHAVSWGHLKTKQSAAAPLISASLILSDVSWLMFCFWISTLLLVFPCSPLSSGKHALSSWITSTFTPSLIFQRPMGSLLVASGGNTPTVLPPLLSLNVTAVGVSCSLATRRQKWTHYNLEWGKDDTGKRTWLSHTKVSSGFCLKCSHTVWAGFTGEKSCDAEQHTFATQSFSAGSIRARLSCRTWDCLFPHIYIFPITNRWQETFWRHKKQTNKHKVTYLMQ